MSYNLNSMKGRYIRGYSRGGGYEEFRVIAHVHILVAKIGFQGFPELAAAGAITNN